ncbi:MAG: DUF4032 domain-containing protein [Endomicrobiales bacterium]|nr:DUF4032 domain-containing protein [Endomicrobiales bacterium]
MILELMERIMSSEEKDILVDFHSIEKNLDSIHQINRGIQEIPIDKIVGSLGRYQDFTEGFLPHHPKSAKYESVKRAMLAGKILPPIKLYKIMDSYFVIDGHHRITVAKNELKAVDIDAEVIEIVFNFELSPDRKYSYDTEQAKDFLILLEEDAFQKKTYLKNDILIYPLKVTELTSYAKLYEEIEDFRRNCENRELARKNIIFSSYLWYEKRFFPAAKIIMEEEVLKMFPKRTYTDVYVWIQQHKYYLSQRAGYDVGFDFTMDDFVQKFRKIKFFELLPQLTQDIIRMIKKEISKKLKL